MMKRRLFIVIAIIAALGIGTGIGIIAAGNLGTSGDPLITLSYLNEKFKSELLTEIDAKIKVQGDAIQAKVEEKLKNADSPSEPAPADAFYLVTLSKGQTINLETGAEIMIREGSAQVAGSAISNTTRGELTNVGSSALLNNMYLASGSGSGFRASSDTVKVLVRGGYTLSS